MLKSSAPPEISLQIASSSRPWARSEAGYEITRRLALAGVIGPPLFVFVFLIDGFIKRGYDPVTTTVSEASIGELGWVQIANFLVFGATVLALSLGLWLGFGDRVSGRIGSVFMGIGGVGFLAAGVFVSDPYPQIVTAHGALHVAASLVAINGVFLACCFFVKRLWTERRFAIWSIVAAVVFTIFFSSSGTPIEDHGLLQRIAIIVFWTWLTFLVLRLWRSSSSQRVGHSR